MDNGASLNTGALQRSGDKSGRVLILRESTTIEATRSASRAVSQQLSTTHPAVFFPFPLLPSV